MFFRKPLTVNLQLTLTAVLLTLTGCGGGTKAPESNELKGAGATFPQLAYSKWVDEYKQEHPALKLSYDPVGSSAGIEQLSAGKVDFAASDMPLTDAELSKFTTKPLHFPTLVGAIVPIYNLPKVTTELKFTSDVLAGIFLGQITSWSDTAIRSINPGTTLPSTPIKVVHRSEGSGTAAVMNNYLGKVSGAWKAKMGNGIASKWPVGETVDGSENEAKMVAQIPGSFGYVEINFAVKNKLAYGSVRNQAGQFVRANFESLGAAVDSMKEMPADFRSIATNGSGPNAYPVASFTYLLVPSKYESKVKRDSMKRFLEWVYTAGQKSALALDYNILPPDLLGKVRDQVERIQ